MKRIFSVILLIAFCISFAACQPTPETPPVASKNDGTMESVLGKGAPDSYRYSAPETYSKNESYFDGKMTVTFDENTKITAQDGIQYPVYEATIDRFDPDTVRHIADIFFDDTPMEQHVDYIARQTKSYYLNEVILPLEEQLANMKNGSYERELQSDEYGKYILQEDGERLYVEDIPIEKRISQTESDIAYFREQMALAPDSYETKPISLDDYEGGTLNVDVMFSDGRIGRLCVYDNVLTANYDYVEWNDTEVDEYLGGVTGYVGSADAWIANSSKDALPEGYVYSDGSTVSYSVDPNLDFDKCATQAKDFLQTLGIEGYSYVGAAYNDYDVVEDGLNINFTYTDCAVLFTRTVGDSYCGVDRYMVDRVNSANGIDRDYETGKIERYGEPFTYEKIVIYVGMDGVKSLFWSSPLKIEREIQSSVELKDDFDTIVENTFNYIRRINVSIEAGDEDTYSESIVYNDIYITDFELRYVMIKEKNKNGYFLLIPAWIVSDTQDMEFTDPTISSAIDYRQGEYVINALDGSIINRNLGY